MRSELKMPEPLQLTGHWFRAGGAAGNKKENDRNLSEECHEEHRRENWSRSAAAVELSLPKTTSALKTGTPDRLLSPALTPTFPAFAECPPPPTTPPATKQAQAKAIPESC